MEVFMKKTAFIFIMFFALFLVVSDTILAKTDTEYDKAFKYYNSKKYKEASLLLKEYVKKRPDPAAYYRIAYALYELRKFNEADEYFKQAYLVDPNFSPVLVAPEGKSPEEAAKIAGKKVSSVKKPSVPSGTKEQQATKQKLAPEKQPAAVPQEHKPQQPVVTPEQKSAPPEPTKVAPPMRTRPPAGLPIFPKAKEFMPGRFPQMLTGLMAGLGMVFLVIGIAVYLYACLCIFIIAKKLDVPAPWTAWIPLVQLWTIVSSAGKPGWWVILFIVPIVGTIVYFYLWICITENLGKNKWLGLLMLLPVINLIFMGMLAFSKTETRGGAVEGATPA
jgi:hypothetical protein